MKFKFAAIFFLLCFFTVFSQENQSSKKWLRIGLIYGYSSQNTFIKQDSDYFYENNIFKVSSHFNLAKKGNHVWELLVEPSYYKSKHQLINYWFISHTVENGDELRARFMPLKSINEYVLNLGVTYRYYVNPKLSIYALGNVGPMYIDTETERLKKGFAFSDIFALGSNYKIDKMSFDLKCMIRHVSNANLQMPNFGFNAVGFEFGTYYEFN
ncbi:MAG TPA: acyloxyacyl hydrolase [Flavobacterium sp.]|nr:acyloxyacyl hydrolase [Flavobacterium sp.]